MALISLAPLGVLLYLASAYVFPALQAAGSDAGIYSVGITLAFTVVAVIAGYSLVRIETERSISAISAGERRLERLFHASGELAQATEPEQVHRLLLKSASSLVHAERAAIWVPKGDDQLRVAECIGMSEERAKANPVALDEGLVGITAAGQMTVREMAPDEFDRSWDQKVYTRTRSDLVVPVLRGDELLGVIDLRNKQGSNRFSASDQQLVESLAAQVVVFLDHALQRSQQANISVQATRIIHDLVERSFTWPGHGENVVNLSLKLARRLKLGQDDQRKLRFAAQLKDLGLIDVDAPRSGPVGGPPEHGRRGAMRVEAVLMWADLADLVRMHTERVDGEGPLGVAGMHISMPARVLKVAEYIDLRTNPSSPWGGASMDEVIAELKAGRDTEFCRLVVNAFLTELGRET